MNRFYTLSFLLHLAIFSIILLAGRSSFKAIPKFTTYKVSIAPLPQPKIIAPEKTQPEETKKVVEKEKAPPKEKSTPKKETKTTTTSKEIKKGLPDIKPKILTGSGRGFTYSYYLNILLNKISQNWQNPFKGKDVILKSIVYFEVDKSGTIYSIRLEENSGNDIYNETTIRAVTLTKRLPPLPQEFADDYLIVHLEFLTGK
jgi:outer membrane biosynthesis protein TonB